MQTKARSRIGGFLIVSLLLHLLLTLLFTSGIGSRLFPSAPPPSPPPPSLTMLQMVSPDTFIPTEEWQKSDQVDPRTPLQSERNTALRSERSGPQKDSPIPQMEGHPRASMTYQDQPGSRPSPPRPSGPGQPSRPQPQSTPSPQAARSKPAPAQKETEQAKTAPERPREAQKEQEKKIVKEEAEAPKVADPRRPDVFPRDLPDAKPLLPLSPEKPKKPDETASQKQGEKLAEEASQPEAQRPRPRDPTEESQQRPEQKPEPEAAPPPAPPPSPASVPRHRMQLTGGRTAEIGPASPASRETELGRYKARMYRAIGSRWYLEVEQNMALLALGAVQVRFYVQSDGTIRNLQIVSEEGRTEVLRTISSDSVRLSAPFEPFSEGMKTQLGGGFWEEITFTIY
ncbi:hypothetical protein MAMC_00724 [Methylacidimicrobium cyclopophantes]|uniref:TonB C-terminal domain-containing protein n=2 Tax=Methylacidimicrobium cyclopophantes TaxID=1041766 RepID=A0A5E6MCX9_9BACT|nr:hypothetical protein MAMC_00724 [Methylacidimicrobium cyclopophantes]